VLFDVTAHTSFLFVCYEADDLKHFKGNTYPNETNFKENDNTTVTICTTKLSLQAVPRISNPVKEQYKKMTSTFCRKNPKNADQPRNSSRFCAITGLRIVLVELSCGIRSPQFGHRTVASMCQC